MNPLKQLKNAGNSVALLGITLCMTSCTFTSCAPQVVQDVKVDEEQYVVNTSTTDLNTKLGRPVYLSDLAKEYGSGQAALSAVLKYEKVVIDFYADWCGPCRSLGTVLEKLAPQLNNVLFIKINIDEFNPIASQYGVRSIPTLIFFKNGTQVHKATGFSTEKALRNTINTYL